MLSQHGFGAFYDDYEVLARIRNQVVHEGYWENGQIPDDAEIALIRRVLEQSVPALREAQNVIAESGKPIA